MHLILSIILFLALLGLSKRFSRTTGIPWMYSTIVVACWIICGVVLSALSIHDNNFKISFEIILNVLTLPFVILALLAAIKYFLLWAISGLKE